MLDFTSFALRLRRRAEARPERTVAVGVTIGTTSERVPVIWPIPTAERAAHVAVFGASGCGKTMLVGNAIIDEYRRAARSEHAPALIIIDPKGDLVAWVLGALAAETPEVLGRVHCLDPFAAGFPFNLARLDLGNTPLDIRAAQLAGLVSEVSTATGSQRHLGVGARQLDVLTHVILGALDTDDARASVLWALDALTLPQGLSLLANVTRSARAKQFLAGTDLSDELKVSCAARLRSAFAASSQLERIVAAPTSVQWRELLAPGSIVCVDLGSPTGGLTALTALWSNLLVRLAIEHLMERPSPFVGHHVRVVIDEAQLVAPVLSDLAERTLTTGRSRSLSLVTMTQGTALLSSGSDTLLETILTNAATKVVGRLAAPDAERLARLQSVSPGVAESASAMRQRFAGYVCNLEDRAFFSLTPQRRERFRSIDVDVVRVRSADADALRATRQRHALANTPPRSRLADVAEKPARRKPTGAPRSRWG